MGTRLALEVSDDGPGPASAAESDRGESDRGESYRGNSDRGESDRGTGLGLDNTRRRLAHLYGDDQALRLTRDGQWTRVRVELPFHVLANAAPPVADGVVAA